MTGAAPRVFLNGEFIAAGEARISAFDRGFLFGDGVYEVLPAYAGRLFELPRHLRRLQRSLDALGIGNPYDDARWRSVLEALTAELGKVDQSVYLQITRGAGESRRSAVDAGLTPTVFAVSSLADATVASRRERGVSAIVRPDIRWQRCDIKTTSMVANVLLQQAARDAGVEETLLARDGQLIEGASSNLFIVRGDALITPPAGSAMLPGVTRDLVLELARDNGRSCDEAIVTVADLKTADEAWITSGSREVMPLVEVDGSAIGAGTPGRQAQALQTLFTQFKRNAAASTGHE